jgi:hypothetical protein
LGAPFNHSHRDPKLNTTTEPNFRPIQIHQNRAIITHHEFFQADAEESTDAPMTARSFNAQQEKSSELLLVWFLSSPLRKTASQQNEQTHSPFEEIHKRGSFKCI